MVRLPGGARRHWRLCPSCAAIEATDPIRRSPFSPFPVGFTVCSLLEHELYKKHCSIGDLVRPMMMKRTRRWHWLVFCRCVPLADLSRQTNRAFASALNYFFVQCLLDSTFMFRMLQCQ